MKETNYARALASLPAGLTAPEVAARLGVNTPQARILIGRHRYRAADGRTFSQHVTRKLNPDAVDWTQSNADIARQTGVSRERVRFLRKQLGLPFVESRGRRPKCSTQAVIRVPY
jgi:hypothetical protein